MAQFELGMYEVAEILLNASAKPLEVQYMPRASAKVDTVITVALAAATVLLIGVAHKSGSDCARRFGHNVDCGAFEAIFAVFYFAPLAVLFAFSSLALWRRWRFALVAHWLAIAGIVAIPFIDYAALMLTTRWTEHCIAGCSDPSHGRVFAPNPR